MHMTEMKRKKSIKTTTEIKEKNKTRKMGGKAFVLLLLCNGGTLSSMIYGSEPRGTQFPIAVSGVVLSDHTTH